ncbi:hypothetical protein O181_037721 [Austropuccinia psidii MF-1]|uniref:Uncharacterized protein n=1 Tax=Austropuccinia psidii MF-1 TaxID=1389203 RepID=A0A9Q3DCN8_9BASI|nr:hypothetical protein [Austropuccinia psidii MF-1]
MLYNQHMWTHIAHPFFITSQALYQILLHSVPAYFDITDKISIQEFCNENDIPRETHKKVRWINNPEEQNRLSGSIIIHFGNKELARYLVKGNLEYKITHIKPAIFQAGPPQFYNCLKIGHISHFCKNELTFANCGDKNNTHSCNKENSEGLCVRCMKADLDSDTPIDMKSNKYFHYSFRRECPIKEDEIGNTSLARCL